MEILDGLAGKKFLDDEFIDSAVINMKHIDLVLLEVYNSFWKFVGRALVLLLN